MRDRWTPFISLGVAVILHLGIVALIVYGYSAAASHPDRLNQAARRLKTIRGRPVHFVYVKDMVPSKRPPMDPSRLSDMNRRGASPNLKKGSSPDPTSFGRSAVRQIGGPGNAPFSRPAVAPRLPSPKPAPSARRSTGHRALRSAGKAGKNSPKKGSKKGGNKGSTSSGSNNLMALNVPERGGGRNSRVERSGRKGGRSASGAPSHNAQPGKRGIGTQLQKMMVGSLRGGYDNPIASRLNTGSVSFDTAAWDLGPYARKVQELVQSNWHVPQVQAELGQPGWVAIGFVVHKDGSLTDLQVVRKSAIPSYNQSAIDALRASNPLPPLPSEVTIPEIRGLFRFFYNMRDY